jgi:hypothetical protein
MRDSTRPGLIPPSTPVVAGYVDGSFAWTPADWDLFATAIRLGIATSPSSAADILDVESGDATPEDVPGWIDRFHRPGRRRPTVYCSRSAIAAVRAAAAGRAFDWWAATLDGTTSVPGAVAVQFADYGTYDESTILDPTWVGLGVLSGDDMTYLLAGPAATPADLLARRIKIHEWGHLSGFRPPPDWPAEVAMDRLLAEWQQGGAEAVFATLFGA